MTGIFARTRNFVLTTGRLHHGVVIWAGSTVLSNLSALNWVLTFSISVISKAKHPYSNKFSCLIV